MRSQRIFVPLLPLIALLLLHGCRTAPDTPNILLILVDDLGYSGLHCYGNELVETPNIDRLAAEGIRFTSAYASGPVCSPTRAALLTGKNPAVLNLTDWIPGRQASRGGPHPHEKLIVPKFNQHLPPGEITVAELLDSAGYRTASIGKWHLGGEGHLPTDQGFGLNVAGNEKGAPPSYHYPYRSERSDFRITPLELTGDSLYLTERLTNEAIRFIRRKSGSPFFLYLPFYNVHTPLEGPPDLVKKYEARLARNRNDSIRRNPAFLAMIESVDRNVGRIMQCLQEEELDENTLVIFTSDNGGLYIRNGKNIRASWNHPLRNGKGTLYEGGLRVPAIVRWTGVIPPARISDEIIISTDFFPTIMAVADIRVAHEIEGVNLFPHLTGGVPVDRETLYWHYPHYHRGMPGAAIRRGDLKLIEYFEEGALELYDLSVDIGETTSLAESDPQTTGALRQELEAWRRATGARLPAPNPDYDPDPRPE